MRDLLIKNLGAIVKGTIEDGLYAEADAIAVHQGLIVEIGDTKQLEEAAYKNVVDANGQTAIPGFIDTHVHNGVEDYNACTQTVGMLEEALFNGTTTMISEGEQGPGYPRFYGDLDGIKAQTIFSNRVFKYFRPGGALKLHAGALVMTSGLLQTDFEELSRKGIWLVAEIGGGGLSDMSELQTLVKWAKESGFFISVHLAPPSIPGSAWLHAEDVISLGPDKIAHVNGGTTSSSWEEITDVIDHTDAGIELIPAGNAPKFIRILNYLREKGQLNRVVFGSDAPTGACALPGAINRAVVMAASMGGIPAWQAIAMATGNAAALYGLPVGMLSVGKPADIVIIDAPPCGEGKDALQAIETGDLFGCSLVIVDGRIIANHGRDTRATTHNCLLNGQEIHSADIYEFLYRPPVHFASMRH